MRYTKLCRAVPAGAVLAVVAALILLNLLGTRSSESLYKSGSLDIRCGSQSAVLDAEAITRLCTEEFDATFQRKVGPAEERHYTGVSLTTLLAEAGISTEGTATVAVVSLDQYRIELPLEEALRPGNLYLARMWDGAALPAGEGPYLLVIRNDALSTRWVKQVVRLEVDAEQ